MGVERGWLGYDILIEEKKAEAILMEDVVVNESENVAVDVLIDVECES